jgi:excisionase family DNA binding protein
MKGKGPVSKARTIDLTDPLMTTQEVADFLGIPKTTLETWRVRGGGPVALRVGRHRRYRREDVDRWLNEREVA